MKWFSLVMFVALLTMAIMSIANNPQATDGYVFERKQFTNSNIRVTMVYYDSLEELRLEAKIREFGNTDQLLAFAEGHRKFCEIHTVDPEISYHPERYGHELMHCIHGRWHDEQFTITLPGEGMPVNED